MTDKEKFLKVKSYEEFNKRRDEFKHLTFDEDIISHMAKIFSKINDCMMEELYKTPPFIQCKSCQNWKGFSGCCLYPHVINVMQGEFNEESCPYYA